ncbi:MAG: aminoglycoside phosphotransferase family protein [Chitinophagaceae bacterium]
MLKSVLSAFGINERKLIVEPFGNGLINNTWKITTSDNIYILQRVNQLVFNSPVKISTNINLIAAFLKEHFSQYLFVAALPALNGETLVYDEGKGYFRLFPFIQGSHTIDVVDTPEQAYEAAKQFGQFTKLLAGFDAGLLYDTIPSFHDLSLRYQQFIDALEKGNQQRVHQSEQLILKIKDWSFIVRKHEEIKVNPAFKSRVTHHDTKISNVLFDDNNKALCVIDLDTIMPGYFISDVGDMMRTYLSPVSEEEKDFSKIEIREAYYKAIADGYYGEMKNELTDTEKEHFFYAGTFMIYMQAIRFLTDYINNDIYYGAKYPEHNFDRAGNQVAMLEKFFKKQPVLENYLEKAMKE